MVPIKRHKYIMIKRKRCVVFRKQCVKKQCKVVRIKKFWEGKKIIIKRFRRCQLKKISRKYKRAKCCRFTRVCQGKKCRDIKRGCFYQGKKVLIEIDTILRWKVICRDIPFGKGRNIRLNCCKVQQRCVKDGPAFRCENLKRSKCWWRGAVRGDVWIQDQNGEWNEVNVEGSFRYLDDKENGIVVDTQFSKQGSGSVTTAIILSARKSTIKATRDGVVSINNKKYTTSSGTLLIKFLHNRVTTKIIKNSQKFTTIIRGLTSDRLGFVYDPKTKSFELTVVSQELSKGLFVDPEFPRSYQLSKKTIKVWSLYCI